MVNDIRIYRGKKPVVLLYGCSSIYHQMKSLLKSSGRNVKVLHNHPNYLDLLDPVSQPQGVIIVNINGMVCYSGPMIPLNEIVQKMNGLV